MAVDFGRAKHIFEFCSRVFGVIGAWPLHPTYLRFSIWTVYLILHISMLFADLYMVFGNVELMVVNLCETAYDIMIVGKVMVMRFSKKLVKLMIRIIDELDVEYFENSEEEQIYIQYNSMGTSFFKIWFAVGLIAAIAFNSKPLEYRLKAVLYNESQPYILTHQTRFPFAIDTDWKFWLVWTYGIPLVYMAVCQSATIGFLLILVLHVCGQLAVLTNRVRNIRPDQHKTDDHFKLMFRKLVTYHLHILETARWLNDVFSPVLLEELLLSTLLIGLTCYNSIENVDFHSTVMFVAYALFVLTLLVLVYGYCVTGEFLITESTKLYEAYYLCEWCDMSDSVKKQLIICMIGAKKPVELTGGGIYTFSLFSFMSVLKSAAGYISMLRTMSG